jgi:hypothetical protein
MKKQSISDKFILSAIERGYYADMQGNVYSPEGNKIGQSQVKKSGHLSVCLYAKDINDRNYQSVLVHRFIAAYHFGPSALQTQCVRHLNDIPNDNRKTNLSPGTASQNRRDICPKKLSKLAKANAPALVARSRKLTDQAIHDMREQRQLSGTPYAVIADEFGVSAMTTYRAINKQAWKNVA